MVTPAEYVSNSVQYSSHVLTTTITRINGRAPGYLGSLPINRLVWVRILRHTDGLVLSWKGWVSKQLSGPQTLLKERLEVLISELGWVLNRARRCLLVSRHVVSECTVQVSKRCKQAAFKCRLGAHLSE